MSPKEGILPEALEYHTGKHMCRGQEYEGDEDERCPDGAVVDALNEAVLLLVVADNILQEAMLALQAMGSGRKPQKTKGLVN